MYLGILPAEFCPQEFYRSEICPYPQKGNLPVGILHIGILPYGILPAGNLPSRVTIHVSTLYSKILRLSNVYCSVAESVEHQALTQMQDLHAVGSSPVRANFFLNFFFTYFEQVLVCKIPTGKFPTCKIPAGKIPTGRFPRADFHGQISGVLIFCGQNSCMQNSYGYNSK